MKPLSVAVSALAISVAGMAAQAHERDNVHREGDAQDLAIYLTDVAMRDYMLNCGGCHRVDGKGLEALGIPDFRNSIGLFTHLKQGRDYMIRVPGAAQSQLSDAALADVLNWMVARYAPRQAALPYLPFTAREVGRVRAQRYDDVAQARRALTRELEAMQLQPAPYTYGTGHDQRTPAR